MKHLGMATAALAGLLLVAPVAEADHAAEPDVCSERSAADAVNWHFSLQAANSKDCQKICGKFTGLCRSLTNLQAKCDRQNIGATFGYIKTLCKNEPTGAKECVADLRPARKRSQQRIRETRAGELVLCAESGAKCKQGCPR